MNFRALQFPLRLRSVSVLSVCLLTFFFFNIASSIGQTNTASKKAITLDPPTGWDFQEHAFDARGNLLPEAPANFRRLGEVKAGEIGSLHTLTLRFSEPLTVSQFKSTKDFPIQRGGSCAEGRAYAANETCTLLVRFTPQGPGNRLGHLVIGASSTTGSQPVFYGFGLGGYGYSPVINFIPSVINTVPGTITSNVGLLSGAHNLWVDGGDTLWIADSGNNVIRQLDSSGNFITLASGYPSPWGIAVDTFGQAYFDVPSTGTMYEIYDYGPVVQASGAGTSGCTVSAPCTLSSEALGNPGEMSIDPYNNLFFVDSHQGAAKATVQPTPASLIFLYDPFPYQQSPAAPMAVDASDNLYSLWANGGVCEIVQQSLYNAENGIVAFNKIAGGHTCGFAGDGGLAGNAEIGNTIGQFFFDAAGDMYFSDTQNQRVRRIDYATGVIHTIAGNGTAGYSGDGGRATAAKLGNPTGVALDSQGEVYIISSATTGQVIRKVGSQGAIVFPNQGKGKPSSAQPLTVTNTGNSSMTLTSAVITGTNATDFKIDNTTTNCFLTAGSVLSSGQTCRIGFIFTPSAVGARSATLTLLDNTVNGADQVILSGTGVLPSPSFAITAPANGASFTSGTAVTFSASVTSTSGPQPTGTVQFKVDGANYGSPVTVSSTGTASTSVTGLTQTSHTLSCTYSGDANYAAAGPISVTINVVAAAKVNFTTPLAGQVFSGTTSLPIRVTVTSVNSPIPTGTIIFTVDGVQVGAAVQLVSGAASTTAGNLAAGTHTIHAHYSGDQYHRSSGASETVTVN